MIQASGISQGIRFDGVIEWSRPVEDEIQFGSNKIKFHDWIIPYDEIKGAVLNSERYFSKPVQSLAIESESGKFLFTFVHQIDENFEFPFNVTITSSRSYFGKKYRIIKIIGLAYVAMVILNIVLHLIAEYYTK